MTSLNRYQRDRAAEVRTILVANFPNCFAAKGRPKKPIARGLHKAIRDRVPGLSKDDVHWALKDYTSGPTYLKVLIEGADRFGLDGEVCGKVDKAAAEFAAKRLRAINRLGAIRSGVEAMKAALPLLRAHRTNLAMVAAQSEADETVPADHWKPALEQHDSLISMFEAAIKEGEACLQA